MQPEKAAPFKGSEPGAPPPHPKHGAAEAVYVYRGEGGAPLFYVCRFPTTRADGTPDKTFSQGHPNGDRWVWSLKGVERRLYHWPELAAHLAAGSPAPIYICEGEKDVDALLEYLAAHELPGTATCNPMGAGKWSDEHTEALHGARHVVVVADKDEQGLAHAHKVAAELRPHVGPLDLVRGAVEEDKADLSDHLAAGCGLEQLVPLEPPPAEAEEEPEPFVGLSNAEVLALQFKAEAHLVADLIECGTVGTFAGVPETFKSWAAQAVAVRVACGEGEVLGRAVEAKGPVGYFWQDDSQRNEAERVKAYSAAHELPEELPLRWFLNEGLELPRDLERLRATIERFGFMLVVLDSFYNFAGGAGVSLKDEDAAFIIAALKAEVCDPTGCAVLIVDHAPWPTEANRQQRRAYGSVLKGAAVRWGVYFEREKSTVYVSGRGNNIRGLTRSPVTWDAEALELRLVEVEGGLDPEAEAAALEWIGAWVAAEYAKDGRCVPRGKAEEAYVEAHPERGSRARARRVITAQLELAEELAGEADTAEENGEQNGEHNLVLAKGNGERPNAVYLYPAGHAPSPLAVGGNGEHGEHPAHATEGEPLAVLAAPLEGGEENGEQVRGGEPEPQEELEEELPRRQARSASQPERQLDENGDAEW